VREHDEFLFRVRQEEAMLVLFRNISWHTWHAFSWLSSTSDVVKGREALVAEQYQAVAPPGQLVGCCGRKIEKFYNQDAGRTSYELFGPSVDRLPFLQPFMQPWLVQRLFTSQPCPQGFHVAEPKHSLLEVLLDIMFILSSHSATKL
jgi:hypothetical protein